MKYKVRWHECNIGRLPAHEPEHVAHVATRAAAVAAVPRGRCGYVNWEDASNRWMILPNGEIDNCRD